MFATFDQKNKDFVGVVNTKILNLKVKTIILAGEKEQNF